MSTTTYVELDELCNSNKVVKHLLRAMRDGRGMDLAKAVNDVSELLPRPQVEEAAAEIQALTVAVQSAVVPRAVVAGNIESWYAGPRTDDRNWPALLRLLREDGLPEDAITDVDEASTKIVAQLPNPHGREEYHSRGLVLGYVQSGKTTNFTSVIAKAADAGYRFFIVLSGVHNALRQQTQDRLNEQLYDSNKDLWHRLTDEADFLPTASVDALLNTKEQRVLAIVKKNGSRLRALKKWLFEAHPDVLADCPVLIIDDEADQATVNTAKQDTDPTVLNRLIRDIVNGLPKSAYVGYTATPFANVLIEPDNVEDLYPRDFIVDLPRPAAYIGPEVIFGREALNFDPDGEEEEGHDFVRSVPEDELDDLRPKGAKARQSFVPSITPSLDAALRYFLLSTAARRVRGTGNRHATALIHTSQHVDVHADMAQVIRGHLSGIVARLSRDELGFMKALEEQWREELEIVPAEAFGEVPVDWEDIRAALPAVAGDARVIVDNSHSEERLHFDRANPRVTIAVGGNTLSRGLTLEGLAVSFFVRSASAYDTLLQMGRWFGYRNGYADLTRIWMTDEMKGWFHHLATVEQEIRYDIERYETEHLNPSQLGVRIRTHPKLAVTSASKMRKAVPADASYSGRRLQTILFEHRDRDWLEANIAAARALIGRSEGEPKRARRSIDLIGPVPTESIMQFLDDYQFHENSRDLDSKLIKRYLVGRMKEGELTHFNIALMARPKPLPALGALDLGAGYELGCINRARIRAIGGSTFADIKALMSRSDRVIDLNLDIADINDMNNAELAAARNLPTRGGRGDGTGLLALYPVSKDSVPTREGSKTRSPLAAVEHVLGVGLVFPETSSSTAKVDYVTADLSSMDGIAVERPDEGDEPVDTDTA